MADDLDLLAPNVLNALEDMSTFEIPAEPIVATESSVKLPTVIENLPEPIEVYDDTMPAEDSEISIPEKVHSQAMELINARDNNRYQLRESTVDKHVYFTLSIKAARKLYGSELSDEATRDELLICILKDVWECFDPTYVT